MRKRKDYPIGEALIKQGFVSLEAVEEAIKLQEKTGEYLGELLIRLGYLKETEFLEVLSTQLGIPYVSLRGAKVSPEALAKVPARLASHYLVFPLSYQDNRITLCVRDPSDLKALDELKAFLGCEIDLVLSDREAIRSAIKRYYGVGAEVLEQMRETEKGRESVSSTQGISFDRIDEATDEATVVQLVNHLLLDAKHSRATDIHLEPFENQFKVRYRVDGILYEAKVPAEIRHFQSAIISRLKVMARLDIAERRLPQDGRILVKTKEGELDLRISILPTPLGESVVIRLLSPTMLLSLEKLGLLRENLDRLEELLKRPHGIVFLTGPTGSGKTTTLYACLHFLNTEDRKIVTIEDPIEYQLKGIIQIQVHPKIGLTFSQGLRSMLRHDPDVMMVGEVRDLETAEITIRTALTGHLVFSTLHTNDAAGAITRLLDMGVEPYLVASSIQCVIAQRLVRVLCLRCKKEHKAKSSAQLRIPEDYQGESYYLGEGCKECNGTGYFGRTAIHEMMVMDDEIQELIMKQTATSEIKKLALKKGMKALRQDGFEKVRTGTTTIDEVLRVSQIGE
jgi:type II secretion system protein E